MTFGIRGGREAGERFIEACELCSHLANVGRRQDARHPPGLDDAPPPRRRGLLAASGVTEDMVRISVGIETLEDVLWDLDRALGAA